jgi:hypothetical protein
MSDPLAAHVTLQSSTTAGSDSTMPNVGMVVQSTRAAYRMVRLVGQGAHGLVYLVQDKDTSQYFCMKVCDHVTLSSNVKRSPCLTAAACHCSVSSYARADERAVL